MPPSTDYQILSGTTVADLQVKVKTAITAGWQVTGGLVYAPNGATHPETRDQYFYQALQKTTDLMAQMNTKLGGIVSSASSIASDTAAIKVSTANIDEKTPEN